MSSEPPVPASNGEPTVPLGNAADEPVMTVDTAPTNIETVSRPRCSSSTGTACGTWS